MTQTATMRIMLNDVFKTNFSIFDNYDETVKKQQIQLINYIETIAYQLEKNLTDVNLFDIFPNNNNIILANEGEINNILINFERDNYFDKPEEAPEVKTLTEEQTAKIENVYKEQFTNRVQELERSANNEIARAQQSMRAYHERMTNASRFREDINRIKQDDCNPMIENLNSVLADERFTFDRFRNNYRDNDTIDFIINDDIINTHVNDRANINIRVNLGKMLMRLTFHNGIQLRVKPYKDNIYVSDHFHPHLDSGGDICLGNMGELFKEAQMNQDILGMFNATMAVLLNYNDNDPYKSLSYFAEKSEQIQPNGEQITIERVDRHQWHVCHHCESDIEVRFAPEGDSDYSEEQCDECEEYSEYEYVY